MSRSIGSSDVATILGYSPWGDPYDTWSRVRGDVDYEHRDTASQRRGRILESALLSWYGQEVVAAVVAGPDIRSAPVSGPESWMHCRPDGYAYPSTLAGVDEWVVEVKTARTLRPQDGWGPAGTDRVPLHYLLQCVWHMACTEMQRCDLVAYSPLTDDLRIYTIPRRLDVEAKVVGHCRRWYQRHIVYGEPPKIVDPDAAKRALAMAYPKGEDERPVAVADDDLVKHAELIREARRNAGYWKVRAGQLEAELCKQMGEAGTLETAGGVRIATWNDRKGAERIDAKRLRADHPELAAKYTTTSKPGRSFSFKLEKAP